MDRRLVDQSDSSDSEPSTSGRSEPEDEAGGDIPFEMLEQLRRDGGGTVPGGPKKSAAYQAALRKFSRENKNRPVEASAKRPVPRFREVIQAPHREARDPRFDGLSGKFVDERFRKQYAFVYDEQLPEERQQLKKALQRTKADGSKAEVQAQLTRVELQIKEEQARRQRQQILAEQKAKERQAVKAGKKPFFLKRSEAKKAELVVKYQALKASGSLEKAMAKRRRKNAAKDHRYVPGTRRADT
ncbi:hypothetical protein WJX72_002543 [[Myrmecia] bisecta]|uniref:rRNA biogenesis protein RRP36 n=1 Tax=[Myrmecia] bisecta TaxID=41462 RepID=A0AAW1PGL5_9CHLO